MEVQGAKGRGGLDSAPPKKAEKPVESAPPEQLQSQANAVDKPPQQAPREAQPQEKEQELMVRREVEQKERGLGGSVSVTA
jgi:hypothetical protein